VQADRDLAGRPGVRDGERHAADLAVRTGGDQRVVDRVISRNLPTVWTDRSCRR
jgi:hypothetical protein